MEYLNIYLSNDICNIILDYKYHLELLEHKISFKNTLNLIKNIDRMEIFLGVSNVTFIYIRKNKRQKILQYNLDYMGNIIYLKKMYFLDYNKIHDSFQIRVVLDKSQDKNLWNDFYSRDTYKEMRKYDNFLK
tara:strand:- start:98 stop:493 length:396 start_codon:yes stop_codon:yes gene_type:complete